MLTHEQLRRVSDNLRKLVNSNNYNIEIHRFANKMGYLCTISVIRDKGDCLMERTFTINDSELGVAREVELYEYIIQKNPEIFL